MYWRSFISQVFATVFYFVRFSIKYFFKCSLIFKNVHRFKNYSGIAKSVPKFPKKKTHEYEKCQWLKNAPVFLKMFMIFKNIHESKNIYQFKKYLNFIFLQIQNYFELKKCSQNFIKCSQISKNVTKFPKMCRNLKIEK